MPKKILFLLGSANMSGGTYVILQHAQYLQLQGYEVTLALVFMDMSSYIQLKNSDTCWHPAIKSLRFISIDDAAKEHYDLAIFTWWATFFSLEKVHADALAYFVQSIEARFYPKTYTFIRHMVNKTYQMDIPIITEATWIQDYLTKHYSAKCHLVKNGILKTVYTENGPALASKSPHQLRILVEGPLESAFKNVQRTIELCQQANVGEIWLLTSSPVQHYPGVTRVFSQIAIEKVPEVYRSCDVLVKLSYVEGMFGPPLEIFHCGGTAIVYDVTGYDEYIEHDINAIVVKTDNEQDVVNSLRKLQQDREHLNRLIDGARKTANEWITWEMSSALFAQTVDQIPQQSEQQIQTIHDKFQRGFHEYLEVISIKNGQQCNSLNKAIPLHETGHYQLTVPLENGMNQLGVVFGKKYRRLMILNLEIKGSGNTSIDGKMNVHCEQLTQNQDQTFDCQSDLAMLIVEASVNTNQSQAYLIIKFMPIVDCVNVSEHQIVDHSLMIS